MQEQMYKAAKNDKKYKKHLSFLAEYFILLNRQRCQKELALCRLLFTYIISKHQGGRKNVLC